jgi:hypothetical protein
VSAFEVVEEMAIERMKLSDRNTVLKVRVQLFSELVRAETKMELKAIKQAEKATKQAIKKKPAPKVL